MNKHLVSGLALASALSAAPVLAQTAEGFALNRFDPSERGSDWFVAESLDLRGHVRPALGVVVNWAHRPLVIYQDGEEREALIEDQLFAHVGGSVVLWDRLRLSVDLPIAVYQNGNTLTLDGEEFSSNNDAAVSDLRLGADVRIAGKYGSPFTLAGGLQLYVPTGSRDAFTSDGTVRVAPRALVAGEIGPFVYAARLQLNVRPDDDSYAGNARGSELFGAAAAGLKLTEYVVLGPEVFTSTVVADADAFFEDTATPVEILFGGHFRAGDAHLGAGFGPGLGHGVGAPEFRGLLTLEWAPRYEEAAPAPVAAVTPPPPPADADQDGIADADDACPAEAGPAHEDPKQHGCAPRDRDRDGVLDDEDACLDVPGLKSDVATHNGCPDADADGILDTADACPNEAGAVSDDPKQNGCPPPKDSDKDGILDATDACPREPGPENADPKQNGCPLAHIEADEIKILEPVKFANNSDRILPESEGVLSAVLAVLNSHPEISMVEVHGHTDNKGSDAANLKLSQRRAASVKSWLVAHGVAGDRVTSQGFGETKPIDTNDTEVGRRNNRRVEFRILAGQPQ